LFPGLLIDSFFEKKLVLRPQADDFPNQENVDQDGDRKDDRDLQFTA